MPQSVRCLFPTKAHGLLLGLCFPQAWMYVISSGMLCDTTFFQVSFHAGMLLCLIVLAIAGCRPSITKSFTLPRKVNVCSSVLVATITFFWGLLGPGGPLVIQIFLGMILGGCISFCFAAWFVILCRFPVHDAFCYTLLGFSLGALGCLVLSALSLVLVEISYAIAALLPLLSVVAMLRCSSIGWTDSEVVRKKSESKGMRLLERSSAVLWIQIAVYALIFGNGLIFNILQKSVSGSEDMPAIRLLNYSLRILFPLILFFWMVLRIKGGDESYRSLFSSIMLVVAFMLLIAWFVVDLGMVVSYALIFLARNLVLLLLFLSCIKLVSVTGGGPLVIFGIARGAYELLVLLGIMVHAVFGGALDSLHFEHAAVYITALCVFLFLTSCFFSTAQGLGCGPVATVDSTKVESGKKANHDSDDILRERYGFSDREMEILGLFSRGYSKRRIGETMCLSENTVRWYLQQIYASLGVHNRDELLSLLDSAGSLSIDCRGLDKRDFDES